MRPKKFLYLNNICVPIIGWVPIDDKFSENSNAPDKLWVSEIPTDCILFALQKSFKWSILIAPSHIEYWECIFKWLYDF